MTPIEQSIDGGAPPDQRQVRHWIRLAQGGDTDARNALLRTHFKLVTYLVKKYHRSGAFIEMSDLIQHGCIGFLKAVEDFDLQRKHKGKHIRFTTYVGLCVMQTVLREIANHGRTIAVPVYVQDYMRRVTRAHRETSKPQQKSTNVSKTAVAFGFSADRARFLNVTALEVVPLELYAEGEEYVERAMPSLGAETSNIDHLLANLDSRDQIARLMRTLPQRERIIIEKHFGLTPGATPQTLLQISQAMGLSEERVRQIEMRGIKLMKQIAALIAPDSISQGRTNTNGGSHNPQPRNVNLNARRE